MKLRKKYFDQDWDVDYKAYELHSHVHENQVEGLLFFAERMAWPYMKEVRDYAPNVYEKVHDGQTIPTHLFDWLFGLTLPGKWMSFKIMVALIVCTPSISPRPRDVHWPYLDGGFVLLKLSYWRIRTVLGRVLAVFLVSCPCAGGSGHVMCLWNLAQKKRR